MDFNKIIFDVVKKGQKYQASILTNFEFGGDNYCIYTIPNLDNYDVYCAKFVDGILVDINDEKEKRMVDNIVSNLVNSVK